MSHQRRAPNSHALRLAQQVEEMKLEGDTTYQLKERLSEMLEEKTQLNKELVKCKNDNAYLRFRNEGLNLEIEQNAAQTDLLQMEVDGAAQQLTAIKRDLNDERQMHNYAEEVRPCVRRGS